jgi:hypothetical protein
MMAGTLHLMGNDGGDVALVGGAYRWVHLSISHQPRPSERLCPCDHCLSDTRDQSQRDNMCPDPPRPGPRRPISRPFPPVKIQSGDKSPHSEIRTPVAVHSSDQIADRHYGVLRLVGALDFLRALSFSSDIHPFRSFATRRPRHAWSDIRLHVPLGPKCRQRHGASSPARDQSQRDNMCPDTQRPCPPRPDLRRPISRPTPPVKIQSGDKSPHSSGKRKDDGGGTLRFRF